MSAQTQMILEMLQAGKIDVAQAELLLNQIKDNTPSGNSASTLNKKFLRVLVLEDEAPKVRLNIPLALAEVGLQLIPKEKLSIQGNSINVDDILNMINEGLEGELVNIDAMDKGKAVSVKIAVQ